MRLCIYVCVCVYVCMYRVYVCMYVCTDACRAFQCVRARKHIGLAMIAQLEHRLSPQQCTSSTHSQSKTVCTHPTTHVYMQAQCMICALANVLNDTKFGNNVLTRPRTHTQKSSLVYTYRYIHSFLDTYILPTSCIHT